MASFCQAYISTGNSVAANSDNGTTWGFTFPAAVGLGNCLILKISYPIAGVISTISDTVNGSWSTTPVKSVTGAAMKLDTYIFAGSAAGKNIVTVVFTAAQQPVVATTIEWAGIATSGAANGSSGTASVAATALSCGSFTPGANTGGNLLLAFFDIDATSAGGGNPTSFTAGTSFTLNDANIAWNQGQGLPNASEYFEQITPAAINPAMTTAGDTNNYNCVAIALKESAGAGTPPAAFRVAKFFELTNANQASTSMAMQIPTVGNCLVIGCTQAQTAFNFNSTTDSQGATYTQETPQTDGCQAWFKKGATPSSTLVVTAHFAAIPNQGVSMFAWDIVGADPTSPLGAVASTAGAILGPGSIAHLPDITPLSTNSVIIGLLNVGAGPVTALTAPAGAYFDCPIYPTPGHTDASTMDFGDGQAHYYNSDLTTKNFTWTDGNATSSTIGSLAIEIKAAPIAPSGVVPVLASPISFRPYTMAPFLNRLIVGPPPAFVPLTVPPLLHVGTIFQPNPRAPFLNRLPPQGAFTTSVTVALSATCSIMMKGSAAATAQTAMAAQGEIQLKSNSAAIGQASLQARGTIQAKSVAGAASAAAMAARATLQTKSATSATGAAALVARATAAVKAATATTGIAPLSGRASIMTKAAGGAAGAVPLVGRITIMTKAAATPGLVTALSARATMMLKAAGAQTAAMLLAAHLTLQVKGNANTVPPPAATGRPRIYIYW